jgi:hypothetical protein
LGNLKGCNPIIDYEIAKLQNYEVQVTDHERDRNFTVRRLQRAELLDHQEQEDNDGAA